MHSLLSYIMLLGQHNCTIPGVTLGVHLLLRPCPKGAFYSEIFQRRHV